MVGDVAETFIVLLRGVMPTGKNRVPMARLREVLAEAGFGNARTYIQSGNALVDTSLSIRETEAAIRKLILEKIGPDLTVVARTSGQIEKMLAKRPFPEEEAGRTFYTFFSSEPPKKKAEEVAFQTTPPEKISFTEGAAYSYVPDSFARSKLNNNSLEKKLGVAATTRNSNTLRALVALAKER